MVLQKHVDGEETIFATMVVPLVKNPLGGFLEVIRRGNYQVMAEDNRWAYERV